MRFYVAGVFDEGVTLDENRLEHYATTMETLRLWHREGVVESYEFFAERMGGIAIFAVRDLEELEGLLDSLPLVGEDAFTLSVNELVEMTPEEDSIRDLVARQLGR